MLNPYDKKKDPNGSIIILVAEDGFERIDLQVMGLTSYHCSTPRCS